jgi:NAD(P)-dependent dehydrogenase (short-subunit alcohol dehydrogenase family)
VGHLGIKVTAIEPGGIKTGWGAEARREVPNMLPEYEPSVGRTLERLREYAGKEAGDPARIAAVVAKLANHDSPPVHLLLGADALRFAGETEAARAATDKRWKDVSLSTDYSAPATLPQFPAS